MIFDDPANLETSVQEKKNAPENVIHTVVVPVSVLGIKFGCSKIWNG